MPPKRRSARGAVRQEASVTRRHSPQETTLELEFLSGLRPFVLKELKPHKHVKLTKQSGDALELSYTGQLAALFGLRYVAALYLRTPFEIPRPKALLGDQHFRRLVAAINQALSLHPPGTYRGFRFSAAGSDSAVFARLAEAVAKATGLRFDEEGELLLRVRPVKNGWEVLTRLTPRPLSARDWRVCNLPGGLNATLAAAMNDLARPTPGERYLNAMCGSGTLLAEQALLKKGVELVGCDIDAAALECARANLSQLGLEPTPELLQADARQLPFGDQRFDSITADVPWGDAVGTHRDNAELYPAFLTEAARVATKTARLVVLTHEIKLFERVLAAQRHWTLVKAVRVFHGGHYPRVYVLEASGR